MEPGGSPARSCIAKKIQTDTRHNLHPWMLQGQDRRSKGQRSIPRTLVIGSFSEKRHAFPSDARAYTKFGQFAMVLSKNATIPSLDLNSVSLPSSTGFPEQTSSLLRGPTGLQIHTKKGRGKRSVTFEIQSQFDPVLVSL
ncbi:UNVERIFIED_CONTAM: hypothetical protein FKN15_026669 [Acipenser sinensis]